MLQTNTGAAAIALDNSQAMLDYAQKIADQGKASVQFILDDMQDFTLQARQVLLLPICNDCSTSVIHTSCAGVFICATYLDGDQLKLQACRAS